MFVFGFEGPSLAQAFKSEEDRLILPVLIYLNNSFKVFKRLSLRLIGK